MFKSFKSTVDFVRLVLVALLFVAMAFNAYTGDYGMAIIDLLLIIVFELQNLNDKFKSGF